MHKLAYIFLTVLFLFSCSKNEGGGAAPNYFIKAKMNGELTEFNYNVIGQKGFAEDNIIHLVFGAQLNSGEYFPAYDLELWSLDGNISKGNYSEADYSIQSRYTLDGFTRYNNFYNDVDDYVIMITSMSDTEVSGKFSGTITNDDDVDIAITEGEFFVPLKD
ncbi:MAG: hypothetical protein WBM83_00425 [Flavobacteriaceae bacterium]